jgi:hypothetical protein
MSALIIRMRMVAIEFGMCRSGRKGGGRRCRQAAISDVAKELALDWHTVKGLEIQYMKAQLAGAGTPGPLVIGIDEIAIRAPVALEAKTPLIARSQL